jgi:hypothetical protein
MKFMFSTVYRVTQKDFYAHPYTAMWVLNVALPHLHTDVTTFLDETFLDVGSEEEVLLPGPLDLRI